MNLDNNSMDDLLCGVYRDDLEAARIFLGEHEKKKSLCDKEKTSPWSWIFQGVAVLAVVFFSYQGIATLGPSPLDSHMKGLSQSGILSSVQQDFRRGWDRFLIIISQEENYE